MNDSSGVLRVDRVQELSGSRSRDNGRKRQQGGGRRSP